MVMDMIHNFIDKLYLIVLLIWIVFLNSCGEPRSSSGKGDENFIDRDYGSLRFQLKWPNQMDKSMPAIVPDKRIDCEGQGISEIIAECLNENGDKLATGKWRCSDRKGVLSGIKPGENRTLEIYTSDINGTSFYNFKKTELTVTAGKTEEIGEIEMAFLYPGVHGGTYEGMESGLWRIEIDTRGIVTGVLNYGADVFEFTGSVQASGDLIGTLNTCLSETLCITVDGQVTDDGRINAFWRNSSPDDSETHSTELKYASKLPRIVYADVDTDGYGDRNKAKLTLLENEPDYVTDSSDCDDTSDKISPASKEICENGRDDNCNDTVDEDSDETPCANEYEGIYGGKFNGPYSGLWRMEIDYRGVAKVYLDVHYLNGSEYIYNNNFSILTGHIESSGYFTYTLDACNPSSQSCLVIEGQIADDKSVTGRWAFGDLDSLDSAGGAIMSSPDIPVLTYEDNDSDGYSDPNTIYLTQDPNDPNHELENTDCNDGNDHIYPGAQEICANDIDEDCDGEIDETSSESPCQDSPLEYSREYAGTFTSNLTSEEDGLWRMEVDSQRTLEMFLYHPYLNSVLHLQGSLGSNGEIIQNMEGCIGGCPIIEGRINANNEVQGSWEYSGIQGDFRGSDENVIPRLVYRDDDGDGYGDLVINKLTQLQNEPGYVPNNTDCNDRDDKINPGTQEICANETDDDCDGQVDENVPASSCIIDYTGTYGGGFSGGAYLNGNGLWHMEIDAEGNLTGYVYHESINLATLSGELGEDGFFESESDSQFCYANYGCLVVEGTIEPDKEVSGVWYYSRFRSSQADLWSRDSAFVPVVAYLDNDGDGYGDMNIENAILTTSIDNEPDYVLIGTDCDDDNIDVNPGVEGTCLNE